MTVIGFFVLQNSHTLVTEADITTVVNIPVGRDKGTNGQVTVNFMVSSQVYINYC